MSICRLCHKDAELCDSHIIPEFIFKPCYDDKHRMRILTTNATFQKRYRIMPQKGPREKLLCKQCELKFSRWERYASQILFHKMSAQPHAYKDAFVVPGVDYGIFKLFQLSLLWRAGVSKLHDFNLVKLGPHEEKIRLMLFEENPGRCYEYGCVIMRSKGLPKEFEEVVMMPEMIKIESHRCVRFILNGFFWIYFVSSHTNRIPYPRIFMTEQGELPIGWDHNMSLKFFKQLADDFHRAGVI
jgi:hypothetical protein